MATKTNITTTLLGKQYVGRPIGLAFRLWRLEQEGKSAKAVALLDAHDRIAKAFDREPYDLAGDFTVQPLEGGFCVRAWG